MSDFRPSHGKTPLKPTRIRDNSDALNTSPAHPAQPRASIHGNAGFNTDISNTIENQRAINNLSLPVRDRNTLTWINPADISLSGSPAGRSSSQRITSDRISALQQRVFQPENPYNRWEDATANQHEFEGILFGVRHNEEVGGTANSANNDAFDAAFVRADVDSSIIEQAATKDITQEQTSGCRETLSPSLTLTSPPYFTTTCQIKSSKHIPEFIAARPVTPECPLSLEVEVRHAIAQAARNVYRSHILSDEMYTEFGREHDALQKLFVGNGSWIARSMRKLAKTEKNGKCEKKKGGGAVVDSE